MIKVRDVELKFDPSNPTHIVRFNTESAQHQERVAALRSPDTTKENWLDEYVAYLNGFLQSFATYLDNVFGDDVAQRLLGAEPGIEDCFAVDDEIGTAITEHLSVFQDRAHRFLPNRQTHKQ